MSLVLIEEVKRSLEEFVVKELFAGAPEHTWPKQQIADTVKS
jgi:hypothetical protein